MANVAQLAMRWNTVNTENNRLWTLLAKPYHPTWSIIHLGYRIGYGTTIKDSRFLTSYYELLLVMSFLSPSTIFR
jgi:hypothetical protein